MMKEYEISDLGLTKNFFGIQVKQKKSEIFIFYEKYVDDLLKIFNMPNCMHMSTPMGMNEKLKRYDNDELANEQIYRSLVRSLIYLIYIRPNIVHIISVVSSYIEKPSKSHLIAAKLILRYVKGTKNFGTKYEVENKVKLIRYLDSDGASCQDDVKGTS